VAAILVEARRLRRRRSSQNMGPVLAPNQRISQVLRTGFHPHLKSALFNGFVYIAFIRTDLGDSLLVGARRKQVEPSHSRSCKWAGVFSRRWS
jgi:hypothetical protein